MRLLTIILGQPEFKILVKGEKLFTHGIEIILSDIGFQKMKQIIIEEEQKHFSEATTVVKKFPADIHKFVTDFAKKVINNTESKSAVIPESRQVNTLCEETAKELFRLNDKINKISNALAKTIGFHF